MSFDGIPFFRIDAPQKLHEEHHEAAREWCRLFDEWHMQMLAEAVARHGVDFDYTDWFHASFKRAAIMRIDGERKEILRAADTEIRRRQRDRFRPDSLNRAT